MPNVKMPDGTQVNFPDDMPSSEIKGLILQKFPQDAMQSEFEGKKKRSLIERGANLGAAYTDARTWGLGPKIAAGVGSVIAKPVLEGVELVTGNEAPPLSELYKSGVDMYAAGGKQAFQDDPALAIGATLAGGLKTANTVAKTKFGAAVTNWASQGGRAARSAKMAVSAAPGGAIYGAGAADVGDELSGAAKGAVISSAVAGSLPIAAAGLTALNTKTIIPNSEGIKKFASSLFKKYDEQGGVLSISQADDFFDEISAMRPQTEFGTATRGESPVDALLKRWQSFKGKPLTFQAAKEADEELGDLAYSTMDNFGKLDADGQKFLKIQQALRERIYSAPGGQVLKDARNAWSASLHMRDIERIINRASRSDQPASTLRSGFRTLLDNAKNTKGIPKAELKALEKAAQTGVVTDLLRLAGSGLVPIGAAVTGGAAGGPLAAAAAGTAAYGMQQGSKALATSRQLGRANEALNLMGKRSGAAVTTKRIDVEALQKEFVRLKGQAAQALAKTK